MEDTSSTKFMNAHQKNNGITIIRNASTDWRLALAGVQSAPEDHSRYSNGRHNASSAKNAARRIYFARKSLLPTICLLACEASKVNFAIRATTALARPDVEKSIINKCL